jgi:hypothetical protein
MNSQVRVNGYSAPGRTGIDAVKVAGPGYVVLREGGYFFPVVCLEIEHIQVRDHPPFGDQTTSLSRA